MVPCRSHIAQWRQGESSQVQPWMRQGQFRGLQNSITNSENIDVDGARSGLCTRVPHATQVLFDPQASEQDSERVKCRPNQQGTVQEEGVGLESPGLRPMIPTMRDHLTDARLDGWNRCVQLRARISEISSQEQGHLYFRHGRKAIRAGLPS